MILNIWNINLAQGFGMNDKKHKCIASLYILFRWFWLIHQIRKIIRNCMSIYKNNFFCKCLYIEINKFWVLSLNIQSKLILFFFKLKIHWFSSYVLSSRLLNASLAREPGLSNYNISKLIDNKPLYLQIAVPISTFSCYYKNKNKII